MDPRNERLIRRLDAGLFTEPEPQFTTQSGNPVADYFRDKATASKKALGMNMARAMALPAAKPMATNELPGPYGLALRILSIPTGLYGFTRGQRAMTNFGDMLQNTDAAERWETAGPFTLEEK